MFGEDKEQKKLQTIQLCSKENRALKANLSALCLSRRLKGRGILDCWNCAA